MTRLGLTRIFPTLMISILFALSSAAQTDQCPLTIERTVSQVQAVCKDLPTDTTCYGHRHLELVLASPQTVTFSTPGDQIALGVVDTIQSFPINPETSDYGTAVINAQGTTVLTLGGVDLRQDSPQAFTFLADYAASPCGDAPSALAIYAPTPVNLTLNTHALTIEGVLIFQQQSANSITASVQRGTLQTTDGASASQGQTLSAVVDNSGSILYWSAARPTNGEEIAAAGTVVRLLESLGVALACQSSYTVVSGDTLGILAQRYNTTIEAIAAASGVTDINVISVGQVLNIPCADASAPPSQAPTVCDGQVIHIVSGGENMYQIALRYNTTIEAISAANGITNPRLLSIGQQLVIPCGVDYGTGGALPPSAAPLQPSETLQQSCENLATMPVPEGFESFGMGAAYFYNLVCQPAP